MSISREALTALRELLEAAAPAVDETKPVGARAVSPPARREASQGAPSPFDMINAIPIADVARWLGLVRDDGGAACPKGCHDRGAPSSVVFLEEANRLKCSHATCASVGPRGGGVRSPIDLVAEVRGITPKKAARMLAAEFGIDAFPKKAPKPLPSSAPAKATAMTDLGNAERLMRRHGQDLRYVPAWKLWLRWDGKRWARITDEELHALAIETARGIYDEVAEAGQRGDRDLAGELLKHAQRTESAASLANMVRVARAIPGVAVAVDALDADPWLLCCPSGTLELQTGVLREHRREDLITRMAGAEVDFGARSEAWERFLAGATWIAPECTESDAEPCQDCEACLRAERDSRELHDFLQVCAGYALTGDTSEERMWLLQGEAGSGKSTVLEALRGVLGEYAITAEFATFTRRERGDHGPRPDIARLAGARLVVASEGEDGQRLSEALVKNVTGGERITARFLYGLDFEFRPQFKLWLATNHAPAVRHDDSGIWRRLLRLPFAHALPEGQRDPRLKAEIIDMQRSGAAVLAWALRGLERWRAEGLRVPDCVRSSVESYRDSQDLLADFLADKCVFAPSAVTGTKELKVAYKDWKAEIGERYAPGWQRVTERLRVEGCRYDIGWIKGRKARAWFGIGLQADGEFSDADERPARNGTVHSLYRSLPGTVPRACAHGMLTGTKCTKCESVPSVGETGGLRF